jgi:hypothetical protein
VGLWRFKLFVPRKKKEFDILYIEWRREGGGKDWDVMLFNRIVIRLGVLNRAKKYRNFSIKRRGR